jgi:hypothetical protein
MLRLLSCTLFLIPFIVFAQRSPSYLSFELGGNGIVASVNYGKAIYMHQRYKLMLQAGLGWPPKIAKSTSVFDIPVQFTCNFGEKKTFFEAGLGASFLFNTRFNQSGIDLAEQNKSDEFYVSPIIGLRREYGNWFTRVNICPLFHVSGEHVQDKVTKNFSRVGIGIGAIF